VAVPVPPHRRLGIGMQDLPTVRVEVGRDAHAVVVASGARWRREAHACVGTSRRIY
jgi:hypothetical protein